MNDTFDNIVSKTKEIVDKVGNKTSNFIDVTKLKMNATDIENEISAIYKSIGQLAYDAYKQGEDMPDLVGDCFERLNDKYIQLEDVRRQIDDRKNLLRCHVCDTTNPDENVFCKRCGAKIR